MRQLEIENPIVNEPIIFGRPEPKGDPDQERPALGTTWIHPDHRDTLKNLKPVIIPEPAFFSMMLDTGRLSPGHRISVKGGLNHERRKKGK